MCSIPIDYYNYHSLQIKQTQTIKPSQNPSLRGNSKPLARINIGRCIMAIDRFLKSLYTRQSGRLLHFCTGFRRFRAFVDEFLMHFVALAEVGVFAGLVLEVWGRCV